jgi:hypothetical protein
MQEADNAPKIEAVILAYLRGLIEKKCIQLSIPKSKGELDGVRESLCSVEKTVQYLRVLSCCYKLVIGMIPPPSLLVVDSLSEKKTISKR